jgi:general secretion pathway protein A
MPWLNSEIGFVVASGACALLVCLLVIWKKFAQMASRSASGSTTAAPVTPDSFARKHGWNQDSPRTVISKRPSGILMCTEVKDSPRDKTESRAPENAASRGAAREDFQISPLPALAPVNTPAPNFANFDHAKTAKFPAGVTPISTFKENGLPAPALGTVATSADQAERKTRSAEAAPAQGTRAVATFSERPPAQGLLKYYGLRQQPFDVTPDPAFLYLSPSHREALTALSQGIEHFRGFMMLVAEPGMGKTILLNKLIDKLGDSARVVFLFQTQCTSTELLSFILNELEVDHAGMDAVEMHRALNQALLEEMLRGQRFVLIVDEAQNLSEPVLETIRLLSDFETTHSKLLQIVLAGQPQLAETLMSPSLIQLRQRIAVVSHLNPLSPRETTEYIEHRLRAAGWTGKPQFTRDALVHIADLSEGIPRTINNLCFNALLQTFHYREEIVDANMVRMAADKINPEKLGGPRHNELVPGSVPWQARAAAPRNSRAR